MAGGSTFGSTSFLNYKRQWAKESVQVKQLKEKKLILNRGIYSSLQQQKAPYMWGAMQEAWEIEEFRFQSEEEKAEDQGRKWHWELCAGGLP